MEPIVGVKGKDFIMLAADSSHKIEFVNYIARIMSLNKMINSYELVPKADTYFTRQELTDYWRTRYAFQVNMLVAGYDKNDSALLTFIDRMANILAVDHGKNGLCGKFWENILDFNYHENITQDEAYEVMKKCAREIQKRMVISQQRFHVMVVDVSGVRRLDDLTAENLKI